MDCKISALKTLERIGFSSIPESILPSKSIGFCPQRDPFLRILQRANSPHHSILSPRRRSLCIFQSKMRVIKKKWEAVNVNTFLFHLHFILSLF